MAIEVGHVPDDFDAFGRVERRRIDPRPGDRDHPQAVHPPSGCRKRRGRPPQQRLTDAGPADRDDDDPLVRMEAELRPELVASFDQGRRVEPGDIAREGEAGRDGTIPTGTT